MVGPSVCGLILTATTNFATLPRHSAHKMVVSMVVRMQQVIASGGLMTGW